MERFITQELKKWMTQVDRLPLLMRGARQVGKSYCIEQFGKTEFDNVVTVNFELRPELIKCFTSLEPVTILSRLKLYLNDPVIPGKTLLFLDEIQDCPNAIRALRYFKENMSELHVIAAGSLLEFTLNDAEFRMPVGRVQSIFLKPLSFKEFLVATKKTALREYIESVALNDKFDEPVHQLLLAAVREYFVIGGMPAIIMNHISSEDPQTFQNLQIALINNFRNDFGKYASKVQHKYLQRLYEKLPDLIAQQFKYKDVEPTMRSRDLKTALEQLSYAGLLYLCHSTQASGLPLNALTNEKRFKLFALDIGLVMRSTRLEAELLIEKPDLLLVNRGALAEQFVAQEFLSRQNYYEEPQIFYWHRETKSSSAEVDFVTHVNSQIIPVEVKAGSTGRLRSIRQFMTEKNVGLGIRISQHPLAYEKGLISLPLYMTSELSRIVKGR